MAKKMSAAEKAKRRAKKDARRKSRKAGKTGTGPANKLLVVRAKAEWPGGHIKLRIPYNADGSFINKDIKLRQPHPITTAAKQRFEVGASVLSRALGGLQETFKEMGVSLDYFWKPTAAEDAEPIKDQPKQ